jgi:hypothetical protein
LKVSKSVSLFVRPKVMALELRARVRLKRLPEMETEELK